MLEARLGDVARVRAEVPAYTESRSIRPSRPSTISHVMAIDLREITSETVRTICELEVAVDQRSFVAPNAVSIAEAHFNPGHWMRAILGRRQIAIIEMARNHVDVDVKDVLAGRLVVLPDGRAECVEGVLDCLSRPADTTKEFGVECRREVIQRPDPGAAHTRSRPGRSCPRSNAVPCRDAS